MEAIRTLLFKLRQTEEADDDLTDEDIAELDRRRALSSEGRARAILQKNPFACCEQSIKVDSL
ncbi:MAG: hypothetical protein IPJ85_06950 [Flavobacteriales bacterium]|nr:hypothetical protein [Flavobacteriales bacterium]